MPASYAEFLGSKVPTIHASGIEPLPTHESLFPFQAAIVRWAVKRGRAAIFADTGLGKTRMQIEWVRQITDATQLNGLIVAPLAVAEQTIEEAALMGVEIRFAESQPVGTGIYVTNYEKLHRFDPDGWGGIVLDESSILKSTDGKTRGRLLSDWTAVPYRVCCTATPAPNDISELANHCEFLGVMSRPEMLASFFVHEEGGDWRLKGHAQEAFYKWMATWAVYVRKPSDLGFDDSGFDLPPLTISERQVAVDLPPDGELFPSMMGGIQGRIAARRGSMAERVAECARLVKGQPGQWLIWCGLNAEQDSIAAELGEDCVSIDGACSDEQKISRERRWRKGEVRCLVTKPSIFGQGMNWQNCHQVAFLGLGDSWESYYQSIRRCWRFGQKSPVEVVIVLSEAESKVAENIRRKEHDAQAVAASVVEHLREFERAEVLESKRETNDYQTGEESGENWRLLLGDCVERIREIGPETIGLSVHSPPFASLYTYSASDRDLGNSKSYDQFFTHYKFLIEGLLRATLPGRRACVHVQQVTTTKVTHGVIGWRDFRADVVRAYIEAGWVYDGEVVIDKDPQAQAIRTKSKALMFVQKNKDSAWSRPAMADYILLFRKDGENPQPIKNDVSNEEWILWARPIWYGIRESETLQASAARTEKDEKHIAPLQLETVERCVRLWSNKGDLVLDPFNGIGTTGYVALQQGRRYIGIELKPEYFRQAVINLKSAVIQPSLFAEA